MSLLVDGVIGTFEQQRQADAQQHCGMDSQDAACSTIGGKPEAASKASQKQGEENSQTTLTAEDFLEGAKQICHALWSTYRDFDQKVRSVNGDMTKVRYARGLSKVAKKLLQHIEHTCRRLPGTQEVRRLMRFNTNAMRVRYGVPIFVTFSPDEAHNLWMVRLSRTRRNDPVFAEESDPVGKRFCGRRDPPLGQIGGVEQEGDVTMDVPIDDIINSLPTYGERRLLLARNSLASVDGFKMLVMVTYEYLPVRYARLHLLSRLQRRLEWMSLSRFIRQQRSHRRRHFREDR